MSSSTARCRPAQSEYDAYYGGYIDLVPDGDILVVLREQMETTCRLLAAVTEEEAAFRYEAGKWTLNEVVRHVLDVEWEFTHRALRFARGDETPLPGVDQDLHIAGVDSSRLRVDFLRTELRHLRRANLAQFEQYPDDAFDRTGVASDCHFTVRALLWIIAGHEIHHRQVIQERYLNPR